jgi:hypothetical protein
MKIIANIATKGDRPEQLKKTLNSLIGQVDHINLYDNSKNKHDYTDNAKFFYLQFLFQQFGTEPIYYLTCDDDIIYPPDYADDLKYHIDKYKCIVSYHGRVLKPTSKSYYRGHTVYDFRQEQPKSIIVDVGGTGVMGFRTDYFNPKYIYESEYKCMSDLVFSLDAKKHNKTIVCAAHRGNWLQQQEVKSSILKDTHLSNQENHLKLVREILTSE